MSNANWLQKLFEETEKEIDKLPVLLKKAHEEDKVSALRDTRYVYFSLKEKSATK